MAPKRGSKRKTNSKPKTRSAPRPKARSQPNQTNALLRQVLVALGGGNGPEPRVVSHGRPSNYSRGFGASTRPYAQPQEFFEGVKYGGRDFARINCPAGKLADYESGTCKDANIFLGKCRKGDFANPFTGTCESYMEPKLGYRYEGNELRHIGVPVESNAWSYMQSQVPTMYPIKDVNWNKGPKYYPPSARGGNGASLGLMS